MTGQEEPASQDLPRALRAVSQVVAPATLVTALLYFFGRQRTLFFYDHFGIRERTLGFTTTDYLLFAQDGLFAPLVVVALGVLLALWARQAVTRLPGTPPWAVRGVGAVAGLAVLFGLVQLVRPGLGVAGWVPSWAAPMAFVVGVLAAWWAVRASTVRRTPTEAVAVFLVVGAGLFWAVANYSADVGRSRALEYQRQLADEPGVVVLATTDLRLSGPGVLARECGEPEGDFRFRYDGYVLMLEAGGEYLLIPRRWTPATGVVSSVPATSDVRLDHQSRAAVGSVERC